VSCAPEPASGGTVALILEISHLVEHGQTHAEQLQAAE